MVIGRTYTTLAQRHISKTDERFLLQDKVSAMLKAFLFVLFVAGLFMSIGLSLAMPLLRGHLIYLSWFFISIPFLLIGSLFVILFIHLAYRVWKIGSIYNVLFDKAKGYFIKDGNVICPLSNINHLQIGTDFDACARLVRTELSVVLADGRVVIVDRFRESSEASKLAKDIADYIGVQVTQ